MGSAIFSKHRLEALCDGVFAVVMTLLVLEIKPELEPHAVYFGNFTLIALPLLFSWLYARRAGLTDPVSPLNLTQSLTARMIALTLLGVIMMIASYFDWPYLILLALPVILYLRWQRQTATP